MTNPIPQHSLKDTHGFAAWLNAQGRSPTTIRGYLDDVQYFARWLAQTCRVSPNLTHVTPDVIRQYQQELLDAGAKPQTVNRKLAALVAYGYWAVQAGHLAHNPAIHVRTMRKAASARKCLDDAQRAALLRAIAADLALARQRYPRLWLMRLRDAVMVSILLETGLRTGQLCALKLEDAQMGEDICQINVPISTGSLPESYTLTGPTRQRLAEWLQRRPPVTHQTLFCGQRGAPVIPRSIQRAIQRYATDAGLPDITPQAMKLR
jgi:integrase/recombinase XerC